jgi:hypothetical protein
MGSGVVLRKAIKKYGLQNFTKTILKYFTNKEDMYLYEKEIVNKDLVYNENCYNITYGGRGGNTIITNEQIENHRNKNLQFWNTGDNRLLLSQKLKNNWNNYSEERKSKSILNLDKGRKIHLDNLKNKDCLDKFKKTQSLSSKKFWDSEEGKIKKEVFKEKFKYMWENNPNFIEIRKKLSEENKGYNNRDFKKNWLYKYENVKELFIDLYHSNLPNNVIEYNIKIKYGYSLNFKNVLNYYIYKGYLKDIIEDIKYTDFFCRNSSKGFFLKTIDKTIDKSNIIVYKSFNKEYLDCFIDFYYYLNNRNYSDSYMYNNIDNLSCLKRYKAKLEYYIYLGLIFKVGSERINIRNIFPNSQVKTGKKTIYNINKDFIQNYFLIERSVYEKYKISINGELIQYSRI